MAKTSIVLIHLGNSEPEYLIDCLHQIRLWHPAEQTDLYLIAWPGVTETFSAACTEYQAEFVSTETLTPSAHHQTFLQEYSNYDAGFRDGYWQFVVERFYYLEELLLQRKIESAIYIENDVLLYQNLNLIQNNLEQSIPHMALCFDNDWQGYPSFIVVNNADTLGHLNRFITKHCNSGNTDMKLMSIYARHFPDHLQSLPQISQTQFQRVPDRKTLLGHKPKSDARYLYALCDQLDGHIFDAIAMGQFLTGIDPRNKGGKYILNYRNKSSFYTVDEIEPVWQQDQKARWYLRAKDGNRIVNLHIHSKKLNHFLSDRETVPTADYDDGEIVMNNG